MMVSYPLAQLLHDLIFTQDVFVNILIGPAHGDSGEVGDKLRSKPTNKRLE